LDVIVVYNEPALAADDPDWASEAGVLESVAAVCDALAARGHRARRLGVDASLACCFDMLNDVTGGDVVFNLFEGFAGTGRGEAEITGLLELAGWRVTGSPAATLAWTRDKARTKWLLAGAGLPTPEFELIAPGEAVDIDRVDRLLDAGPLIVKPACEDGSLGISSDSIVHEREAALRQVEKVRARYGGVLVERFIAGREFNAAIVALPRAELLPLSEIEFAGTAEPGMQIVTYDAKWSAASDDYRSTPGRCPASVDPLTARRIGELARAAFRHTGCRDYARVDLRMDTAGEVYVLEVNCNPDLSPGAGFQRALTAAGIAYDEFIDRLVRNARAERPSIAQMRRAERVPP
jgi:D-alanine-D-alanine ligase